MRTLVSVLLSSVLFSSAGLIGQGLGGGPKMSPYTPTYDEVKSALGLTDDQITALKKLQSDKMAATQSFYAKMSDKQKELNGLLESNTTDAAKVGQLMLELQQLRKAPPPTGTDVHEKAMELLNAEQKQKLKKIEEAQKLRTAVDQAQQLALINAPASPAGRPGGPMRPMAPLPAQK